MQASGSKLSMRNVARHLILDEGVLRFWKGAHVMASGCVPSHASYFLLYETLKDWWHLENEEFEVTKSLAIGSCTTFMHDFFITPADGKFRSAYSFKLSNKGFSFARILLRFSA